eukprot:PLAT8853.1.p1 GENE.PLAT8853.1~~PLAT8853.1.p1  ORF type:complete len:217 (-),score=66.36 PLAT8853.1:49-666(-)
MFAKLTSLLLAACCLLAWTPTPTAALCADPSTVPALNVTAYLGVWYQLYADPFVLNTFQKGADCARATYTLFTPNNGSVAVCNDQRTGSPTDGKVKSITGYAYQKDAAAHPGRLDVVLWGGSPFPAPYWVLALGPIVDDQYSWAIVSDQACISLFVLSRHTQLTAEESGTVKGIVGKHWSSKDVIPIKQGGDCVYPTTECQTRQV